MGSVFLVFLVRLCKRITSFFSSSTNGRMTNCKRITKISWAVFRMMSLCLHVSGIPQTKNRTNENSTKVFFSANGKRKSPGLAFSVCCLHAHASCLHVSTFLEFSKRKTELMINDKFHLFSSNGKRRRQAFVGLLPTETENERLFSLVGEQ